MDIQNKLDLIILPGKFQFPSLWEMEAKDQNISRRKKIKVILF